MCTKFWLENLMGRELGVGEPILLKYKGRAHNIDSVLNFVPQGL